MSILDILDQLYFLCDHKVVLSLKGKQFDLNQYRDILVMQIEFWYEDNSYYLLMDEQQFNISKPELIKCLSTLKNEDVIRATVVKNDSLN